MSNIKVVLTPKQKKMLEQIINEGCDGITCEFCPLENMYVGSNDIIAETLLEASK